MPMTSTVLVAAGEVHPNPFVGPIDHTMAIRVDVSMLTTAEVDLKGFLKPGVPFLKSGLLPGAARRLKKLIIAGGAAGAHTVTGIAVGDVIKSVTQNVGAGTAVTDIVDLTAEFLAVAPTADTIDNTGGTATTGDDLVVEYFDMSVYEFVFGCVAEAIKVAKTNSTVDLDAATDIDVGIATIGQVNRAILEDSLGRVLTGNELLAFQSPGSHIVVL